MSPAKNKYAVDIVKLDIATGTSKICRISRFVEFYNNREIRHFKKNIELHDFPRYILAFFLTPFENKIKKINSFLESVLCSKISHKSLVILKFPSLLSPKIGRIFTPELDRPIF